MNGAFKKLIVIMKKICHVHSQVIFYTFKYSRYSTYHIQHKRKKKKRMKYLIAKINEL